MQRSIHNTAAAKASIILVSVLFFLSGAAGLIYQTVWVRLLELYFGVTLTATTLIVSAYMAGLGLGSLLGGRIASKSRNTVFLYGVIEAGIGVFGIFSPLLINWIGQNTAGSPYALVFILSFLLLLLPTLLMGMTLPLLTQAFVTRVETSGQVIGLLYGINTLGAAFGALVSGYFLMGWFGFGGALLAAAWLNFIVGAGAVLFKSRFEIRPAAPPLPALGEANVSARSSLPREIWNYEAILFSAFLVGFIGMGFEMLWFRLLGVFNKHTAYGFPSILFIFLIALALGGWFWGRRVDKASDPVGLFLKLQISVGIAAAFSFLLAWALINLPPLQTWLQANLNVIQQPQPPFTRIAGELAFSRRAFLFGMFEYFLPIFLMVLPAGLLMGGGLPSLDRIAIDHASLSGRRVGDIHLANILGSVLGTLSTSFFLLPLLGSELTFKALSALTLSFLLIYFISRRRLPHGSAVALSFILFVFILLLPGRGEFYARVYQAASGMKSVVLREAGDGVLAITFRGEQTDPADLWIGGIKNSFFPSDGNYERSALTCAAAAKPKRVLIIGLGGGNTANLAASLPGVEEVTIVELMEELGAFLNEHVPVAQSALNRPHVRYIVDDGRRYLYANPNEKFDLIFIDPLWSFTAGHNNLYSQEAARLYQSRLSENGVFCAWANEMHFIPKTLTTVFPYSDAFRDYLVNGSQPLEYDLAYMNEAYSRYIGEYPLYLDERAAAVMEPQAIFENYKRNQSNIRRSEWKIPPLTDMTPWLEYYYACPLYFTRGIHAQQLKFCYSDYSR